MGSCTFVRKRNPVRLVRRSTCRGREVGLLDLWGVVLLSCCCLCASCRRRLRRLARASRILDSLASRSAGVVRGAWLLGVRTLLVRCLVLQMSRCILRLRLSSRGSEGRSFRRRGEVLLRVLDLALPWWVRRSRC